jgi:hypothetical protein
VWAVTVDQEVGGEGSHVFLYVSFGSPGGAVSLPPVVVPDMGDMVRWWPSYWKSHSYWRAVVRSGELRWRGAAS